MNVNKEESTALGIKEAAVFFGMSEDWVYRNWKDLSGVKIGGKILFTKEGLYGCLRKN